MTPLLRICCTGIILDSYIGSSPLPFSSRPTYPEPRSFPTLLDQMRKYRDLRLTGRGAETIIIPRSTTHRSSSSADLSTLYTIYFLILGFRVHSMAHAFPFCTYYGANFSGLIRRGIDTIFETLTHGEHSSGAGGTGLFPWSYLLSFLCLLPLSATTTIKALFSQLSTPARPLAIQIDLPVPF